MKNASYLSLSLPVFAKPRDSEPLGMMTPGISVLIGKDHLGDFCPVPEGPPGDDALT